jgi:hypothetical protein
LSRTAHHTPFAHWRLQGVEVFPNGWIDPYQWPIMHVLYDLRYFAGCRRHPQKVRASVRWGGYVHGHGGSRAAAIRGAEIEGGLRVDWRAFAAAAVKAHRAGGDVDDLLEPDARTRHQALWDLS